jgi:two-component system phosphate regulon sensor histidine kinase PhoR
VEAVIDVTKQEHMQAAAEALRQADRLKAELLGTVSHELRSPLAVIKGYAATLLRHEHRLSPEERHEYLLAIDGACDRLEVLVNQLLEMSQLETGSLKLHSVPVDVEHIVREASIAFEEKLISGGFQDHKIELDFTGAGSLPPVQADPRLLRNAIDILLENALKYSPAGGTIRIRLEIVHDPLESGQSSAGALAGTPAGTLLLKGTPHALIISVEDSGIGIPAEHLDRIFDRFHRVDTGLTREVSGLGLGLSICKRIMELHGGSVWGESTEGEGSTFFVALPLYLVTETSTADLDTFDS